MRLVKGSHIIARKFWQGEQAYLLQNRDNRVIFVNPYEGDLCLIGTTDIPFDGKAEDVEIAPDEVDYLLDVVNRYFVTQLKPGDVVQSFSGVRPLFDDNAANPSAVTRDYVFDVDAPSGAAPMLSVFGGKITTYRKLAEHALEKLRPYFPAMGASWTKGAPSCRAASIPGARFRSLVRRFPQPERTGCRPASLSATRAGTASARWSCWATPNLLTISGAASAVSFYEREARFLMAQEWATTAEDIVMRRTKHALHMTPAGAGKLRRLDRGRRSMSDISSDPEFRPCRRCPRRWAATGSARRRPAATSRSSATVMWSKAPGRQFADSLDHDIMVPVALEGLRAAALRRNGRRFPRACRRRFLPDRPLLEPAFGYFPGAPPQHGTFSAYIPGAIVEPLTAETIRAS